MLLSQFRSHISLLFLLSSPLLATPARKTLHSSNFINLQDTDKLHKVYTPPRCSVHDNVIGGNNISRSIQHFAYFEGKPRWSQRTPMVLTYALSPNNLINYLKISDIRTVFHRAFSRWGSVVPISFNESDDYGFADIRIGFYLGDHGDSEPFDGVLGILAHSFAPESGKLHLDASERWSVNLDSELSKVAVDLESVAMHEIGHVLGLAHSSVKEAIMYPSLSARERRVELKIDDVKGIQRLYGSKRDLRFGSLLASETLSNEASPRFRVYGVLYKWRMILISVVMVYLFWFHA